jgi:glycosyltransferase
MYGLTILDGGSTDSTLDIIKKNGNKIAYCVSEPDNSIYDAINKGIRLATGDVIGVLHSDDFYANNHVIEDIIRHLKERETEGF